MLKINRTLIASAAIALACMGGATVGTSAIAAAQGGGTVTATGGDGTAVDSDGTQGDFTNSVQDAFIISAEEAKPQTTASKK